jgi:hypothetical protein
VQREAQGRGDYQEPCLRDRSRTTKGDPGEGGHGLADHRGSTDALIRFGAINIPLKQLNRDTTANFNRNRPVIVYCYDNQ